MKKQIILSLLFYSSISVGSHNHSLVPYADSSNFTKWETTPELDDALKKYRNLENQLALNTSIQEEDRKKLSKAIGQTTTMCLNQIWPSVKKVAELEKIYKGSNINKDAIMAAHDEAVGHRNEMITIFKLMISAVAKNISSCGKTLEPIKRSSTPKDANVTKFI